MAHARDNFQPRADDVVIATPYRSGISWMQYIVLCLVFQDLGVRAIPEYSMWLDFRLPPLEETLACFEVQTHRVGPRVEKLPDDIRTFWDLWINRGWLDWESDGFLQWSSFHHAQTWWDYRHLSNILSVAQNLF